MKNSVLALSALMLLAAAPAFAGECDEEKGDAAGALAAKVSKDMVSKVVPVTGKQMVNIDTCDFTPAGYTVSYKYNFLSTDGLYWVDVSAKISPAGGLTSFKVVRSSPNFAAAQAKAGVTLAAN